MVHKRVSLVDIEAKVISGCRLSRDWERGQALSPQVRLRPQMVGTQGRGIPGAVPRRWRQLS